MNNPPAFPTSHQEQCDDNSHNNSQKTVIDQDMSLRDYFAAKAMQGMMHDVDQPHCDYIAQKSYQMADAMLKARETNGL